MNNNWHENQQLDFAELVSDLLSSPRRLIVLMGIPGSGKSTIADALAGHGATVVNRDAIRERLNGDSNDPGNWAQVDDEYFRELRAGLNSGGIVVADNINITATHRQPTLWTAHDYDYNDVIIIWVDPPLEVALERNRARERRVADELIVSMHKDMVRFGFPTHNEGALLRLDNSGAPGTFTVIAYRESSKAQESTAQRERLAAIASDLHAQISLLEACIAAGRDNWARATLNAIKDIANESDDRLNSPEPEPPADAEVEAGLEQATEIPATPIAQPERKKTLVARLADKVVGTIWKKR